jgi:hypothetical protein
MARQRQLHLWLNESEYQVLRDLAGVHDETVSALVRRLVRAHHHRMREGRLDGSQLRDGRLDPLAPIGPTTAIGLGRDGTNVR